MKIAYLVGQYPAINHRYLLEEVGILRASGIEILIASVSLPDRPEDRLTPAERDEWRTTYYIKATPKGSILGILLKFALTSPLALFRGVRSAIHLSPSTARGITRHLTYLIEAILLTAWMARTGISHVHVSFSSAVGTIATSISPITMSWGVYGFGEVYDPAGTKLAEKVHASTFVRSISRHLRSLLMIGCPASDWPKLQYVPLGINPADFPPTPFRPAPDPFRIVCVGRLAPEKGQRLLIEAVELLKPRCPGPFVLHLVGDGPDRRDLEQQIASRRLADVISIEGMVGQDALMALYRQTDAFVMASLYEGIPIVLMEAMCMEIPCVAPRITGIPELIEESVDGLLVTPADVDALAAALLQLMSSPELRRRLGVRARERVLREYALEKNTQGLADVLRRYLPANPPIP